MIAATAATAATPWHNGRVERSHRTDDKFFITALVVIAWMTCELKAKPGSENIKICIKESVIICRQ
jgi:hypothetical protein